VTAIDDVAAAPGVRALAQARRFVGVTEDPPGSNRTQFGRWFGADGEPWCAMFLSYCFKVGAGIVLCGGVEGAGAGANGCAYVPTLERWLRDTGQWLTGPPAPGDIAIFNWDGGPPDHIGIVEKDLGNGQFNAIEGNTAVGNDSNGGEVMRRERTLADVDGFGRIA
jgi:CHAP domain-containing protein